MIGSHRKNRNKHIFSDKQLSNLISKIDNVMEQEVVSNPKSSDIQNVMDYIYIPDVQIIIGILQEWSWFININ